MEQGKVVSYFSYFHRLFEAFTQMSPLPER